MGGGQSGIFGIALQAQFADVFDLIWIADDGCLCGKREAFDVEWSGSVAAGGDRHMRVAQNARMFLRISSDEAVEEKAVIDITRRASSDMRPAIGAVGGDSHHPMLIEQPKNEAFKFGPPV
jgi:hypothetical protein